MDRRILLGAAFVLSVGGVYGLLTSNKSAEPSVIITEQGETHIPVWLVRRELKKGELFTLDDLKPGTLPEEDALEQGITTKDRFTFEKGSLINEDLPVDAVLSEHHIVKPDDPRYIDLFTAPDMVPYPLSFDKGNGYPLVLNPGDRVDVVMISSLKQNLANKSTVDSFQGLSVAPLLSTRKVLKVDNNRDSESITVVLELSRKEVSQLMLARRVGVLDVHKSTTTPLPRVRAGDVLPDFSSVTELRGTKKVVN